jgi:N,N-dimethylformamidase
MTLAVTGYASAWSVKPGQTIDFHIATDMPRRYRARIARVFCGDPNPAGPGYREVAVASVLDGLHQGAPRPIVRGNWMEVPRLHMPSTGLALSVTIMPTLPGQEATLVALDGPVPVTLGLERGRVVGCIGEARLEAPVPPTPWRWHDVELHVDAQGDAALHVRPRTPRLDLREEGGDAAHGVARPYGTVSVVVGQGFSGRMEGLRITAAPGAHPMTVAHWDFGLGMNGQLAIDTGPQGAHGRLHNLPMRAMKGVRWDGSVHDWRLDPSHYAAIQFHPDAVGDCGWPVTHTLTVPEDWDSGLYVLHLETEDGSARDNIPFAVRARDPGKRARVAVLMPTFSYQVYTNFRRDDRAAKVEASAPQWGALPQTPSAHPQYGHSTYDWHPDGAGIAMASMRRPAIDKRVNQVQMAGDASHESGVYWLTADTYLLDFLDRAGIPADVLTDHDIHAEGAEALSRYACVLTGQHPEYHSNQTWDAIRGFIDGGGRFMYMGGNGFYWKVAVHPDGPWALEVRRAESGIRVWAAEPGEYHHQFDGTLGGLWCRIGRPPQSLVGVGFSTQGHYKGYPYTWLDGINDPRAAFMRAGLTATPGEKFGERGFMGGGAAGHELDRIDHRLGTPLHALVVAHAVVHDDGYQPVNEERLGHLWPGTVEQLIRSDITFFEAPNGGAVFSVGSMNFIGALPVDGYRNACAKLVENVVRRFADPAPFEVPRG